MLDFPASPTNGQQFTASGVTWSWDGAKWTASGLSASYLPIAGGTLTGPLTLQSDPTIPLGATTKQYTDSAAVAAKLGDNRIINGDMRIDQRNNGATGTASGYTIDRWQYAQAQPNKFTWGRNYNSWPALAGFPYNLGFQSGPAYTPVGGDAFQLLQTIEADMTSDFAWGTANAQPVTLSFWVVSTLAGPFSGVVRNVAATRSYPFSFSLVANTWTKIVVNIPGDTGGTWVMSGNAGGVTLGFDLGCFSTYRAPAGAWVSGLITAATGAINLCANTNAAFNITGVKLEIGSIATPYNRQSLTKSMADCQRYYQFTTIAYVFGAYVPAGVGFGQAFLLPVVMRATPTAVLSNVTYTNANTAVTTNPTPSQIFLSAVGTAAGAANFSCNLSLTAEL